MDSNLYSQAEGGDFREDKGYTFYIGIWKTANGEKGKRDFQPWRISSSRHAWRDTWLYLLFLGLIDSNLL